MEAETSEKQPRTCPECRRPGAAVGIITLKALLCPDALARLQLSDYHFCVNPACSVVYFSPRSIYHKCDLKVRVGLKETDDPIPVCYCFGHTRFSIRGEIERTGTSTAAASITAHIKAGRCGCEVTNPSGSCCLGEVSRVVRALGHIRERD